MEKRLSEILPIMAVENDCILSKQGDVTIAYRVELPEIFTLSNEEYENFHHGWVRALKLLPEYTVVCKQDWFTADKYRTKLAGDNEMSFLADCSARHFNGRPYLRHQCFLMITKKPEDRKLSSSIFSNLVRPTIVPEQTLSEDLLGRFLDSCSQFASILQDSGLVRLHRLPDAELSGGRRQTGLIERYCTLKDGTGTAPLVGDMQLSPTGISIGRNHCQVFALADASVLPQVCGPRVSYEKYSTDRTKFPVGFAAPLGHLLRCNHVYSQYIFIDDARKTIQKLETKRLRLQSLSAYSRENSISRDATNEFLNEAISEHRTPIKAHFNVMVWDENPEKLKDIRGQVSAALAQIDAVAKEETVGAPQIYWAGIPGNAADFPMNDTFDTFLEQAACFFNFEGAPTSVAPGQGIRFCDRLSSQPLYVDMLDAPRHAGITSNMGMLVCGTSGGGKSMTVNHMLNTLYTQGAHCVIVDIGGSYKGLCQLLEGYYFTYEETSPIRFNPFYLPKGQVLDTEKKESLKALLVSLWKQENQDFNRSEYVALSNALSGYYALLEKSQTTFPCFDTFYEYLQTDYVGVLKEHRVKERDFDVDNFLYVLRPYYKGGEFDYLLNARENLDLLNQPFIVFELDQVKDHPILFPVVTLIIIELFISKMRKLRGTRKVLCIDEAWKAIAKSGMAEFLKYAFKTIRKFNGVPIVITQELDDLISSPVIKDAIINNADIKILMDMRKFLNKFDKLQDVLGLSDKGKTILLSVNKDDREIFIDIGGQIQKVYRNELCKEEYWAYTTEGKDRVKVLEAAEQYGSMQAGIAALAAGKAGV